MIPMENLGERIRHKLLQKNGGNQSELARYVGVSPQAVQQWISGETMPREKRVERIAKFLGTTPAALMYGVEYALQPTTENPSKIYEISWSQAAHPYAIDRDTLTKPERSLYEHGPHAFALRIQGVSNYDPSNHKSYEPGVVVYFDPDKPAKNGSMVVVRLPGQDEVIFRRLVIEPDGRRYLEALNPAWPDRIKELPDDADICGVAFARYTDEL